jgi:hypothetical protein
MSKLLFLSVLIISTNTYAKNFVYTLTDHQEIIFKKTSKTTFDKIASTDKGIKSLDIVSTNGTTNVFKHDMNIADNEPNENLEIIGKTKVKILDTKNQVNAVVNAQIDLTVFGNVKSIAISGKDLDEAYAEFYKKTGLDLLKDLKIIGGHVTSKITSSTFACVADKDILTCSQDQELKFSITGNQNTLNDSTWAE